MITLLEVAPLELLGTFSTLSGTLLRGLPSHLALIECLMDILLSHMTQCGRSLLIGSVSSPMHGVIQAIRGICESIK